MGKDRLSI